jgi:hypothetical protein
VQINLDVLRRLGLAPDHLAALQTLADGGSVVELQPLSEALVALAASINAGATEGHTRETVNDLMEVADAASVVNAAITAAEGTETPAPPRPPHERVPIGQLKHRRPARSVPRAQVEQRRTARATLTASSGRPVEGASDVAAEFLARLATFRTPAVSESHHVVARVSADYPEERRLGEDALVASARIEAVTAPEALVASGGICAPVEALYDLPGFSTADRPVRDALAGFMATRGGVRFNPRPKLVDMTPGVGVWSAATDAAPGAQTKPVLNLVCPPEAEIKIDAITHGLRVGNMTSRSAPEMVAAVLELLIARHSRMAETNLLTAITAASVAVDATPGATAIGASRELLTHVERAAVAMRSRHRMQDTAVLRAILPAWARGLLRADLTRAMPGDSMTAATDADLDRHFAVRHIAVTYSLDAQPFAAQVAGPLQSFPATVVWWLWAEGGMLFLDGGTLDLGIVRDSTLNATNDSIVFAESFEQIAPVGPESLRITSTVDASGVVAGQRNPA